VAKGQVICSTVGNTRTEADYLGLAEKVKKRKKCGLGKYGRKKHR
jgi:hypothetical protein